LASVIIPPVAKLQVLPERAERRLSPPPQESTKTYSEQLHLRLQQAPLAPVPRRNPFVFGARSTSPSLTTPAAAPSDREADAPAAPALAAPMVATPSLRLSGVGSTDGVRTAVISDGTTVHLVKVGETVSGYAVVEITDDTVTIADASGAQWRLRMK
jgi:hypothetical protein